MRVEQRDVHYAAQGLADLVRLETDLVERALVSRRLREASDASLEDVYMECVYRLREQGKPISVIASELGADPKWIRARSDEWAAGKGLPVLTVRIGRPPKGATPAAHREQRGSGHP